MAQANIQEWDMTKVAGVTSYLGIIVFLPFYPENNSVSTIRIRLQKVLWTWEHFLN
jgi:hypothetical protein